MPLNFTSGFFDLWVFRRTKGGVEHLLLHTSQEKADRFFGGGRFWQIPTDAVGDEEHITDACRRLLKESGVEPEGVWSADHVYTIYNRCYDAVCAIPVFAAEAGEHTSPSLTWEHSDFGWYDTPGDCSPEALTRSGQGDFHHPAPPLMCLVATPPISARQPAAGEAGSVPAVCRTAPT